VPALPFGWFDAPPGVNRTLGVAWLTAVLYPDRTTADLRADVREFFRLFYHVEPTEAQIDGLLAGAVPAS
jgi:iron complex transport system substrate-binding protein